MSLSAVSLICAKVSEILPTIALLPSLQMSTHWKSQIMSCYYYKNCLTSLYPWKSREESQVFIDGTVTTRGLEKESGTDYGAGLEGKAKIINSLMGLRSERTAMALLCEEDSDGSEHSK